MLPRRDYIQKTLEINLFFLRLAKEHAIFAAAAMPATYEDIITQLLELKNKLESLLKEAVELSQGVLSPEVLASMELVTHLTLEAEQKTQQLTGISIDLEITQMELTLEPEGQGINQAHLFERVTVFNEQAIRTLKIATQANEVLLDQILRCKIATHLYPTIVQHIIIETQFFTMLLEKLQRNEDLTSINEAILEELKLNWNEILKEHAQFVRGQLDPEEDQLFNTADAFSNVFDQLQIGTSLLAVQPEYSPEVLQETLQATASLRDFNQMEVQGILDCDIRTITLPLFVDHLTREANHYLRILHSLMYI
jgi:Domain of unknown function (DUF2935)